MKDTGNFLLSQCGVGPSQRELCRLYASPEPAPADISRWFAGADFEALSSAEVSMASHICARSGYAGAPEELRPRLRGYLRYLRMQNAGLTAGMCELIKQYNAAGIDVLVMKGAAVRLGHFPEQARPMGDADILVRREDFDRAVHLALDAGFSGSWAPHSVGLSRGNIENVDIHSVYLRDLRAGKNREYWPECSPASRGGASFFIPEANALFVQLLVNAFNNFAEHPEGAPCLKWVMDLTPFITREGMLSWEKITSLASKLGVAAQARAALSAYDALLPGMIDMPSLSAALGETRPTRRLCAVIARYRRSSVPFRRPPEGCSSPRLACIHIRWLWFSSRVQNPGSLLHGLRVFPEYLRGELRIKSLWRLPAAAAEKFRRRRGVSASDRA